MDGRRLWFGRAELTEASLQVRGWQGFRPVSRSVPIADLLSLSRHSAVRHSNLEIRQSDGSTWSIEVSAPGLWRLEAVQRIRAARTGEADEIDPGDGARQESGPGETGPQDVESPEAESPEAEPQDVGLPETESPEAEPQDVGLPETESPEAETQDVGPPETEPTETELQQQPQEGPDELEFRLEDDYLMPLARAEALGLSDALWPDTTPAERPPRLPTDDEGAVGDWKTLDQLGTGPGDDR